MMGLLQGDLPANPDEPIHTWCLAAGRDPSTAVHTRLEIEMPRFMVERTFVDGLHIPVNDDGKTTVSNVVGNNAGLGYTWVHSYVSDDKTKTYCIYDGPTPEAIRQAAERNGLPVDRITEVSVLDPYFYQ